MSSIQGRIPRYFLVIFIHLMNHILMFSVPVLLLYIREPFGLDYTLTGALWTILIVVMTVASIGVGYLSDRNHASRFVLIFLGLSLMVTGWFLLVFVTDVIQLGIIFFAMGLGAAGFHPPAFSIITELFEEDKGKALSVNMAVGMAGTAVSPLLFVGVKVLVGSWQNVSMTYGTAGAVLGIASFIAFKVLKFSDVPVRHEQQREKEIPSDGSIAFLAAPLILIPLIFISLRSSFFRTSAIFTSLLFEDYLALTKEQSSIATALVLGFASMFTMVGGLITDRSRPRTAIFISSVGSFFSALFLVFLTDYTDLISFTSFYFLLLAFYYIGSPATSALLADRVRPDQRGKLFGAFFSLGQTLSLFTPIVFGWLKDTYSLNAAFIFMLVLATIALVLGLFIFFEERIREESIRGDKSLLTAIEV